MKVKIFRSVFPELGEENINSFINDINVIDIKVASSNGAVTIVIIYEEPW